VEPIGTITKFYPFLSEDTRIIVEAILKQAEGYDDFVSKMVDIDLAQEDTNDLSYFTTIQAWFSNNLQIIEKLRDRIMEEDVLRPWAYFLHSLGAPIELDWNQVPSTLELALKKSSEDWVRVHVLLIGIDFTGWFLEEFQRQKYLTEIEELIKKCPELTCFSCELHNRLGWNLIREGNIQGALELFEQAYRIASEYNDLLKVAEGQGNISVCFKQSDIFKAIAQADEAYQTYKSIGALSWAAVMARNMGLYHTIIGECDLAAQFYMESLRMNEPNDEAKYAIAVVLARMYCDLDLPDEALEWLKWKRDGKDITPETLSRVTQLEYPQYILAEARTMIQLGQLEGIPQLLDEVHKDILQGGDERSLISYNLVAGLLEISLGNIEEGIQYIVTSLNEAERLKSTALTNSALITLTKAEVLMSKRSKSRGDFESSGPWMTRLEIHSRENGFSGIKMQHALLKAEYQELIGETEAAKLTLQDALTFTDSLGVKTLRKRIQERLRELKTSVDA
jgi:tetratricopeptide (TPR) repeat protein